jgi:hypothetical protein
MSRIDGLRLLKAVEDVESRRASPRSYAPTFRFRAPRLPEVMQIVDFV